MLKNIKTCYYISTNPLSCTVTCLINNCVPLHSNTPVWSFLYTARMGHASLNCNEPTNDNRCILIIKCLCAYTSENDRHIRPIRKFSDKTGMNKTYATRTHTRTSYLHFHNYGNPLYSPLQGLLSKMTPIYFQSFPDMQHCFPSTHDGRII